MISLSGVTKRYGAATAVQDLSFTVNSGETLGLLGQNGAGKTTTLNIITGYLAPTSGDVRVGDYDLLTQPRQAKRLIGYLPEQPPLYDEMTVESYLRFVCRLRLVVEADIARHVRDIAAQTNLSDVLGRRVGNLSKGYRQRVGLAQALCGEPEVLVLDEPTVGLDPRQTAEFRDTLKKLSGGRTVIFSSHILSEVQALCDRVIILHHGRVACDQRLGDMSRGAGARLQAAIFGDGNAAARAALAKQCGARDAPARARGGRGRGADRRQARRCAAKGAFYPALRAANAPDAPDPRRGHAGGCVPALHRGRSGAGEEVTDGGERDEGGNVTFFREESNKEPVCDVKVNWMKTGSGPGHSAGQVKA